VLRGDIRWIEAVSASPGEAAGRRPGVIVSSNGANASATRRGRGMVNVVPVTSNVAVIHRFHVLLHAAEGGLPETSKAQIEQIRSVSAERVGPRIGTVPPRLMRDIDEALRLHLGL
jgi:mRNA interferase MazF